MEICECCEKLSLIKTPRGKNVRNGRFHIADDYSMNCLNCNFKSETFRVYTEFGKKLKQTWYKQIF